MIVLHKRSRYQYPITLYMFPQETTALVEVKPWEIINCSQASEAVKEYYADALISAAPFHTLLTDLTEPLETIRKQFHADRRRHIRCAEAMPLRVTVNQFDADQLFASLVRFYAEKHVLRPTRNYFQVLLPACDLLTIYLEEEEVITHMLLRDHPHRISIAYGWHNVQTNISGKDRARVQAYLLWWELQHYHAQGYRLFDWGGVELDPDHPAYSITTYKQQFGGTLCREWNLLLAGSLMQPFRRLLRRTQSA